MSDVSANAMKVLTARYFAKNDKGEITEGVDEFFNRIAVSVASADPEVDSRVGVDTILDALSTKYRETLQALKFLPNTPTLINAGRRLGMLSACFVLPVEDSIDGIFQTIKDSALIAQAGGGCGFSFSRLRQKGAIVRSTGGVSSGPVSFMKSFNAATESVKQGSVRRGALMGILRVDHPDILEFIDAKQDLSQLTNFNISVAVTDAFMSALAADTDYDLLDPQTHQTCGKLSASTVWDRICKNAWQTGEPGLFFIDTANRYNPTPSKWSYEAMNPCGEQVLGPYESCNLGSINLEKHVLGGDVDWPGLRETTRTATQFLDNVVDANKLPIPELVEVNKGTRRIGLGIMGFARLLIKLGISYDSEEGIAMADKVMAFIAKEANKVSIERGKNYGVYPYYEGSGPARRNSHLLTIAPTGTISMIADTSSGCEPEFALVWYKNVLDGQHLPYALPLFEEIAKREGFWSETLLKRVIENHGSCRGLKEVPTKWQKVFATAHDISAEWHVRMQATFQKHIDAAVSKTINMTQEATVEDVKTAYSMAYKLGCKGITVYRDGSRANQVLNTGVSQGSSKTGVKSGLQWGERAKETGVLTGGRVAIKGKSGKAYVHAYYNKDGRMVELFITPSTEHQEKETAVLFGRIGSLALQYGAPVKAVVAQLVKAHEEAGVSLGSDIQAIAKAITQLDREYNRKAGLDNSRKPEETLDNIEIGACPVCKGKLVYQEGCLKCISCGHSKCG